MEWVSAIDAVHLIAPKIGSDRKAKKAIAERLRDGAVRAKCWWSAIGIDIGEPYVEPKLSIEWSEGDPDPRLDAKYWQIRREKETQPEVSASRVGTGIALSVHQCSSLAQGFWRMADRSDMKTWNWSTGFFIVRSRDRKNQRGPRIRHFALGVTFAKPDILRIGDWSDEAPSAKEPPNKGRLRKPTWGYWAAELLLIHDDKGIENMSATALRDEIAGRLSEKGLPGQADSSAYDIASIVLEVLRDKRA